MKEHKIAPRYLNKIFIAALGKIIRKKGTHLVEQKLRSS